MNAERIQVIRQTLTPKLFPHGGFSEVLELIAAVEEFHKAAAPFVSGPLAEIGVSYFGKSRRDEAERFVRAAGICPCATCLDATLNPLLGLPYSSTRMVLCPTCGNKRCPHSAHHDNPCTGSNEPGQVGSNYQ